MKKMLALLAAVTAVGATAAVADDVLSFNRLNVPHDQWLSPQQISEKMATQGYTVREIESDDGAYEVEMTTKDGMRVETHVHPATGEILHNYDD